MSDGRAPIPLDYATPATAAAPSAWLVGNSIVVIVGCVAFVALSISAILAPETPFAFCGGIVFGPGAVGVGVLQYAAVFRRHRSSAKAVSIIHGVMAGAMVIGTVGNIGEAIMYRRGWSFVGLLGLFVVLGGITAYAAMMALLNGRWSKRLAGDTGV